jgi:hypothetical protein
VRVRRGFAATGNLLSGQIPDNITALGVLAGLQLSSNNLSGTIPSNIGAMLAMGCAP